jgi:FMN-dependent NADH-azoreductase
MMSNLQGKKTDLADRTPILLRIDASPRADDRSRSRRLTARFEEVWQAHNPAGRVVRRDLRLAPPPHVDQEWIEAAFTPDDRRPTAMQRAIATSDALVDELLGADEYLLGVRCTTSACRAHSRRGLTTWSAWAAHFLSTPTILKAVLPAVIAYRATGDRDHYDGDAGYEPKGSLWHMNHVEPHLRTVLGFIGVSDLRFIYSGNNEFGGDRLEGSLEAAARRIVEMATP